MAAARNNSRQKLCVLNEEQSVNGISYNDKLHAHSMIILAKVRPMVMFVQCFVSDLYSVDIQ